MIPETKAEVKIDEDSLKKYVDDRSWAIRPCFIYKDEYNDCTSIRGRFHQYFIHGESIDCTQWKRDFDNCVEFESSQNAKFGKAVIDSEANRRQERMNAHYGNDVWRKRQAPPEDWSKPLPDWMQKRNENTYLDVVSKEMKENGRPAAEARSLCVIM